MKKNNIFVMWRGRGLYMALALKLRNAGLNPAGLSKFSYSTPQTLIA